MSKVKTFRVIKKVNGNNVNVENIPLNKYDTHCETSLISLPEEVVNNLSPEEIITVYTAESRLSDCPMCNHSMSEGEVVLVYKRTLNAEDVPEKPYLWVAPGKGKIKTEQIPQLVYDLCEVSLYYGENKEVIERMFLPIFRMTHHPESLDALYSVPKKYIAKLLGDEKAHIAVQVANQAMRVIRNGGSMENPSREDKRLFLYLAVQHGSARKELEKFI